MAGKRKTGNVVALSALVVLVLPLCLPAASAWGAIYYVSTDGNDSNAGASPKLPWKTITHAAKTAKAGDLVRIKGGDYGAEQVEITNSGTAEAPIRFEGYDGEVRLEGLTKEAEEEMKREAAALRKKEARVKLSLKGKAVNIEGKSHIKISGITALKYGVGIWVRNSHHIRVERCTAGLCGWSAIAVIGSHCCQVKHCTVYNCGMCNITVHGGRDNTVADCWSYLNPRLMGIFPGVDTATDYCYGATDAKSVHFIRCRGDGRLQSGHGLSFTADSGGCRDCEAIDCEMRDCWEQFGARHGSSGIKFINCFADKAGGPRESDYGFRLHTANNVLVKNCRARGVSAGFYANNEAGGRYMHKGGATRDITFENCIAEQCNYGIYLSAPNSKAVNCLSVRNKCGVLIDALKEEVLKGGKELTLKGCIISNNDVGVEGRIPTTGIITRCNVWGNKSGYAGKAKPGEGCVSVDPQFQGGGFVRGDWHLKDTSPCKNMGPYAADPKASIGMR